MVTTREVTELREQTERLAQLEVERHELKNEYVEIVAHDLRSPLTAAEGLATLLFDEWDNLPDAKRLDLVKRIRTSIDRVGKLASDVLEVASVESATCAFEIQPFDLEDLVRSMRSAIGTDSGVC